MNPTQILIVEDEPLTRMVAVDALEDAGLRVLEAGDADEALTLLLNHEGISLVFTDIKMQGELNGLKLARRLSFERLEVALIVT